MIVKKIRFSIATGHIKSECSEVVELEFREDLTEEEIENEIEEAYSNWLFAKNQGNWIEIE